MAILFLFVFAIPIMVITLMIVYSIWYASYHKNRMDRLNINHKFNPNLDIESNLKNYFSNNTMKNELENKLCYLHFWQYSDRMVFSCREHNNKDKNSRYFVVTGNNEHVATMWALCNAEFGSASKLDDFYFLYGWINRGNFQYLHFNEDYFYFETLPPNYAENNYITLSLIQEKENYIVCRELWRGNNAREFFIKSENVSVLFNIISSLKYIKNKNLNYKEFYYKCKKNHNCKVIDKSIKQEAAPLNQNKTQFVDINSAEERELAKLPGINIIMSKKIIKKREEIGGFKNLNEFFDFIKIKAHMESQLREIIVINKMKGNMRIERYNERNMDI